MEGFEYFWIPDYFILYSLCIEDIHYGFICKVSLSCGCKGAIELHPYAVNTLVFLDISLSRCPWSHCMGRGRAISYSV